MIKTNKIISILIFLIIVSGFSINSQAMEVDSFTQRDVYEIKLNDFSPILNKEINRRLDYAVIDYNKNCKPDLSRKETQRLLAFHIFRFLGSRFDIEKEPEIPENLGATAAMDKVLYSPLEYWIIESKSHRNKYIYHLLENIYTLWIAPGYSATNIFRIKDVFIGPDKIDHFFDLGYYYFIISNYGENDRAAVDWGVRTENGWFGIKIDGIFSFADLRANWIGYQFYKSLFSASSPLFSIDKNGQVRRNRDFDIKNWIDWRFDELQNPSIHYGSSLISMGNEVKNYIKKNLVKCNYCDTYRYLKKKGYYNRPRPLPSDEYLNDQIPTKHENVYDIEEFCK